MKQSRAESMTWQNPATLTVFFYEKDDVGRVRFAVNERPCTFGAWRKWMCKTVRNYGPCLLVSET